MAKPNEFNFYKAFSFKKKLIITIDHVMVHYPQGCLVCGRVVRDPKLQRNDWKYKIQSGFNEPLELILLILVEIALYKRWKSLALATENLTW